MNTLELRDVSKRYESPSETIDAIRSVTISIAPGEIHVLLGPSGSGKSTLLLIASGALRPDSGRVLHRGHDLAALTPEGLSTHLRSEVGVAYQDPQLLPGHDVLSNVAIRLLSGPGSLRDAQKASLPWLARVGLGNRLAHRPSELSGGEQRRVALARALVGEPSLLLLDEPTANLDAERRDAILRLVARVAKEGTAVLLVTHDSAATAIATRTHELRDGQLAEAHRRAA